MKDLSNLCFVFPSIFLDHVSQFNDVFSLLVLLADLIGMFVLPTQICSAALAIDVTD
jgi:hypothetical protein